MDSTSHYLAVDLGASSGRVMLGRWDGARLALSEVHRFANGPVAVLGHLHWNVLGLWAAINAGLAHYAAAPSGRLAGLGVDTWGIDFALLDRAGRLLGSPYHYRDARTEGMPALAFSRVPRETIYAATGIQMMPINTLFQLVSMAHTGDPQLAAATTLLPLPNLFSYWLSGQIAAEYTHATTTQCLLARERRWASELLGQLAIPAHIFAPLVEPGSVLGPLRPEVIAATGLRGPAPVIAVASHDTASAVAAVPGLDARSAYISSGTWSLMGCEVPAPVINERAMHANFTNEGGVGGTIRLLKNIAGLWLIQECRRQWAHAGTNYSWAELLALAEAASPFGARIDPDAPAFLSPPDMPAAIRAACARTGQPPPEGAGAVVRCCLESLALRYRATLDDLEELVGHRLDVIHVVGGGSRNRLLCQLTADACDRPVVAGPVEATALGNLVVQMLATGALPDVAAGRAIIAASVTLETYAPRADDRWAEGRAWLRGG